MLKFRTVEYRGPGFCLDIVKGLHEPSEVRGQDFVSPGREGQYVGNRVHHVRNILIEGYISGMGDSLADRQEDFHTKTAAILATLDRALTPGTLEVDGGDYGLPDGDVWSIEARCMDAIGGPMMARWTAQEWSIRLFSLDPEWTVGS